MRGYSKNISILKKNSFGVLMLSTLRFENKKSK